MVKSTAIHYNPLIAARLQLGLTQDVLAQRIGISRNVYIRNEQALYTRINSVILNYFKQLDFPVGSWPDDYREFQHLQRVDNGYRISYVTDWPKDIHPLLHLFACSTLTMASFCRCFCADQGLLYEWTNHYERYNSVPDSLWSILVEAKVAPEVLESLNNDYKEWAAGQRESRIVVTSAHSRLSINLDYPDSSGWSVPSVSRGTEHELYASDTGA